MDKINNLEELERKIGIKFRNKSLLRQSLIHRSYLNEAKEVQSSNERLEFLGDSVLSFITSVYLYKEFPHLDEGNYTDIKSTIVKTESLAKAARSLNLGRYLKLSKGEIKINGRNNPHILENTFEALIGAIYLDQGIKKAFEFIKRHLFEENGLREIVEQSSYVSYKTRLQEFLQKKKGTLPFYKILEEKGPQHSKTFKVGVYFKDKLLAVAKGKTKKKAEENAAKKVIESLGNL